MGKGRWNGDRGGIVRRLEWYLIGALPGPKDPFRAAGRVRRLAGPIRASDGKYALALQNIAKGKFYSAEVMLLEALGNLAAEAGQTDLSAGRIYAGLILATSYAGRFQEALDWGDKLTPLAKGDHWHLTLLGRLYFVNGRWDKAELLIRREIEVAEQAPNSEKTFIANRLYNLGEVLRMTDRLNEAEDMYKRGMQVYQLAEGAGQPKLVVFLIRLAVVYRAINRPEEVKKVLEQSAVICKEGVRKKHPDAPEALYWLAGWYEKTKEWSKAREWYEQIAGMEEPRLGRDHPKVKRVLEALERCGEKIEEQGEEGKPGKGEKTSEEKKRGGKRGIPMSAGKRMLVFYLAVLLTGLLGYLLCRYSRSGGLLAVPMILFVQQLGRKWYPVPWKGLIPEGCHNFWKWYGYLWAVNLLALSLSAIVDVVIHHETSRFIGYWVWICAGTLVPLPGLKIYKDFQKVRGRGDLFRKKAE